MATPQDDAKNAQRTTDGTNPPLARGVLGALLLVTAGLLAAPALASDGPSGVAEPELATTIDAPAPSSHQVSVSASGSAGTGGCVAQYYPSTQQWEYYGCYAYVSGTSEAEAHPLTSGKNDVTVEIECTALSGYDDKFQICPSRGNDERSNTCTWGLLQEGCTVDQVVTEQTHGNRLGPVDCGETLYAVASVDGTVDADAYATSLLDDDTDSDQAGPGGDFVRSFDTYCP